MTVGGNVNAIGYVSLGTLNDSVKALRINDDNAIEVSLDGSTYFVTSSSGHIIQDDEGNVVEQKSRLQFEGASVTNVGDVTVIKGFQGPQGEKGETGETGATGA